MLECWLDLLPVSSQLSDIAVVGYLFPAFAEAVQYRRSEQALFKKQAMLGRPSSVQIPEGYQAKARQWQIYLERP